MNERKIHNHKSEIHVDRTIEQYGYHPDKLGRTSTKFVVANCRFCGQTMPVRKGFFNKAGSACHKQCRMKEQSLCGSPFASKKVRDKSKKTNLERYGFEYASQNKKIGRRISIARKSKKREKIENLLYTIDPLGETSVHEYDDHIAISFIDHDLVFILNFNDNCIEQVTGNHTSQLKKREYWNVRRMRCFQIFDHQWENRSDQILNFLRTILHFNDIKVAGRKCKVNNDECKDFLNAHHIQGYGQGTKKFFNLTYDGEIIATMTASKHHRQGQDDKAIVLNRLCFKNGFNVQGGSSKLFKRMIKWAREKGFTAIKSWSDNCWTEGDIYRVLGFELIREYGPDYFYWDLNRKYHSKQTQQKKKTGCPEGTTEREWCIERGLSRIWDCGKKCWEYALVC